MFAGRPATALVLTDTEDVTIQANVSGPPPVGGGGASGYVGIPKTSVRFSGEAYPRATVTVLKEGKEWVSVPADDAGYFTVTIEEAYSHNVFYSLIAKDLVGNRSLLINYPISVYSGYLTHLSGIRFAPTVTTDKAVAKSGDFLDVSGYALPTRDIQIILEGQEKNIYSLVSGADGRYKMTIPLGALAKGEYLVSAKYGEDTRISKLIQFVVGEANIFNVDSLAPLPGDCNVDHVINLVDFSVLAFWYGKKNPPVCVDTNKDGIINLVDFSILAFYWTG